MTDRLEYPHLARAAKDVAGYLASALELHRRTPTGKVKTCLPECVACDALAEYARLTRSVTSEKTP